MTSPLPRSRVRTHVGAWSLTAVLLGAAWLVNSVALPDGSSEASFVTAATQGKAATTRNFTVTVTDIRAARELTYQDSWSASGSWLVVELDAQTDDSQEGAILGIAELTIGERTYRATERAPSFFRQKLVTGVPRSGDVAFELPEDALKGTATLRLSATSDARYDGVVELVLHLDDLPVERSVALRATQWTHR